MEANAVAVIGLAGRFPGAADVRAFWKNLSAGVDAVRHFTDDELRAAGEKEELLADPNYVKACGRLEGIDMFDAGFFGMSPRDASIFDPQHRLFLECAWEAFEHAGYVGETVSGPVGVFASCGMSDYMIKNLMTNAEVMTNVGEWLVRHTGNDTNFLATRVSYELNLRGPSMNVQTACSSSLVAVHLACQSLLNGECDLALAGGATIYAEQDKGYLWRDGDILSADGRTRSFDVSATGTVMSNAVACVVLKRLSDAVHDGDNVLAVVRGSAINNDGRDKAGYLAPSVSGQARAVTEALAVAGVSAEDISYVEAHGTGTRIGDPIEIAALTQAFRAQTAKTAYCAIGSLKSSIGHTGEASGAAAFVKAVMALANRAIPPSLHCESPNPRCEFPSSPFFVNTRLRPWEAPRRLAGITSLGAGGTNCHVVVEEAPARPESAPSGGHELLVVSARTEAALEAATRNLVRHLGDHPGESLADVAFTLAVGRKAFRHRRAIVAASGEDAVRAVAAMDPQAVFTGQPAAVPRKVVFLLPGTGPRYAGMARELYETQSLFAQTVDACLAQAQPSLKSDLRAYLLPSQSGGGGSGEAAGHPSLTAAATFVVEYALGRLLQSWGIAPTALVGRGAGEYAAACLAGVLSAGDALTLVAARAGGLAAPVAGAIHLGKPATPLVSSRTGTWMTDAEATDPGSWIDSPGGIDRIDEGLRALQEDRGRLVVTLEPGSDLPLLLALVGRSWTTGEVPVSRLHEGQGRRRVPLPTYPWQRQRYWLTPGQPSTATATAPRLQVAPEPPLADYERPSLASSFVAPRTPLERELAAVWRELLGVEHIGVRDDFFELGGQSLIAVRLFTRIRKKYGIDLPLSTLLEAPTIEKGAAIIAAASRPSSGSQPARAPAGETPSLVAIERGDGRTPFYCVHGAGGNVLNFRDLSRELGAEQPFYGLQARGIDGVLHPHESIEEMAAAYVDEVRVLQPRGPYLLGGYSGGGLVAFEMARRIAESGEAVGLLALIDTFHPSVPVRELTLSRLLERARGEGLGAYLSRSIGRRVAERRAHRRLDEAERYASRGEPIPAELRDCHLVDCFEKALMRYRPLPWDGRAILFRAEEIDYIYGDVSPAYGWEGVISDITIARVPGNHDNLLLGPHAPVLIAALRRAIDEARAGAHLPISRSAPLLRVASGGDAAE